MVSDICQVAEQLQSEAARLLGPSVDTIFRELPSYSAISRRALTGSVKINFERAINTLVEGEVPVEGDWGEHRSITLQRIDQGIPIEDIIRSYRLSLKKIHARYIEVCAELELSHREALRGAALLWDLGDWFVSGAAAEYRYRAGSEAVRRSLARAELMREILLEDGPSPANLDRLEEMGVQVGQDHSILITSPAATAGPHLSRLSRCLALSAPVGRRIIALLQEGVHVRADGSPVAVGPPVPLESISYSAAIAERIWHTARSMSPAVYRLDDFGWRLAVSAEPTIGRFLVDRYIEPVFPESPGGKEMIRTLVCLLRNDMNVRAAALELVVHQNTLRYRIEAYRKTTGVELTSVNAQFELAWALHAYQEGKSPAPFGEFYRPGL